MSTVNFTSGTKFRVGDTVEIAIMARNDAGMPDTGVTCNLAIRRQSDSFWWDQVGINWQAAKIQNIMTQVSVDLPGSYRLAVSLGQLFPTDLEATLYLEAQSDGPGAPANPTEIQTVSIEHGLNTLLVNDDIIANPAVTLGDVLRALRAFLTGDSQLDDTSKQLVYFEDDGVTPMLRFDVTDAAAQPSVREVFKRVRVP